ncbi:MAG: LysE family translocator, partial [Cyclobacteriaceae bacterium]
HLTFICVVSFGINQILLWSVDYFIIIKWIGVLYLLYLGIRKFYVSSQESIPEARKQNNFIFTGFLVTITNPKSLLFYGAFFPPFLNLQAPLPSQYITLGATFISLFILYSSIFTLFSTALINTFTERASMKIQRISGACLIAAAILLASLKKLAK